MAGNHSRAAHVSPVAVHEHNEQKPRRRWLRRIMLAVLVVVLGALAYGGWYAHQLLPVASGYLAKELCAGHFLIGHDNRDELNEDNPALAWFDAEIDADAQQVTCSIFGCYTRTAVRRPGHGVTLMVNDTLVAAPPPVPVGTVSPWPGTVSFDAQGCALNLPPELDREALRLALDAAFAEPNPQRLRRTRALLVLANGRLIAERYAPGYDRDTRFTGWSMSKTVAALLLGIAAERGCFDTAEPVPVASWPADDPRAAITWEHLLRMRSGLVFNETYGGVDDVTRMLFASGDVAGYTAARPLGHAPGTHWYYSSGDTNLLCRCLQNCLGDQADDFPRAALFAPLGLEHAELDRDAAGTWIGSSGLWASARDWARIGLLMARDGAWFGQQVVPAAWCEWMREPTAGTPDGKGFGAHLWLNTPSGPAGAAWMPDLPGDIFSLWGHFSQFVTVVPSHEVVIVRLGLSKGRGTWDHEACVASILAAFRPVPDPSTHAE